MKWAALVLLGTSAAFAAEPPREPPIKCKDSGTTQEMAACARETLEKADRKLNETYQALMRKESGNKAFLAKMRESQKAWIRFRDAELAAIFACDSDDMRHCWGTMHSLDHPYHKARLTNERQIQLQQMLDRGRP